MFILLFNWNLNISGFGFLLNLAILTPQSSAVLPWGMLFHLSRALNVASLGGGMKSPSWDDRRMIAIRGCSLHMQSTAPASTAPSLFPCLSLRLSGFPVNTVQPRCLTDDDQAVGESIAKFPNLCFTHTMHL